MIWLWDADPENGKRLAKVRVSLDVMAAALHLPKGSVVHAIEKTDRYGEVELIVEHPDLPMVGPGNVLGEATPALREEHLCLGESRILTRTICDGWR